MKHLNRDLLPGIQLDVESLQRMMYLLGNNVVVQAVILMLNSIFGVTVAGLEGTIKYLPVKDAIVQRFVDTKDVESYREAGICFGRKVSGEFKPKLEKLEGKISRYM